MSFWSSLPKPFFALAPLYDVTDVAFREMIARHGKPDLMFTEFVSTDGLAHPVAREKLIKLHFGSTEAQSPVVAQLWGANPEHFYSAAKLVSELGFAGIDINMGCPDKKVVAQGGGAALISTPSLAKEIISACKSGGEGLPVSVKTRTGFLEDTLEEWLGHLLEAAPAAITIHARTRKQMSKTAADWDAVRRAVVVAKGTGILILGNGDVKTPEEGQSKAEETGADGIMIGRGVFGNYWLFSGRKDISQEEKLNALAEHAELFERYFAGIRNFVMLRKHFAEFASGFPGAKELRAKLMFAKNSEEVRKIIGLNFQANSL